MATQSGNRLGTSIVIAGLLVATSVWVFGRVPTVPVRTMRVAVSLPAGDSLATSDGEYPGLALSPDGTQLAYVAAHNGVTQLYLRDTADWNARAIPGTGDAHTPFFSPDGQWLGAVVGNKLVKIPVAGGPAVTLTSTGFRIHGARWASDGWIYAGTEPPLALVKFPSAGGAPLGASGVDDDHGETDHRFPDLLPGGKWLLFAARKVSHNYDEAEIAAISLKNSDRKSILKSGTDPHYLIGGHLVFLRGGVLMAVAFDPDRLQVEGEPVPVVEGVMENPGLGAGQYSVSGNGSLAYVPGPASYGDREMVSVDRTGSARVLSQHKQPYTEVAPSPDGKQIAVTIAGPVTDIWLHDVASGAEKLYLAGGEHRSPAWSADGKDLFYSAYTGKEDAQWVILRKAADGTGAEQTLRVGEMPVMPWFASRDGGILLYEISSRTGNTATEMVKLDGSRVGRSLTPRDFDQEWAQFSPDGHWLAYNSNESGQQEVYLTDYPGLVTKLKVSSDGGRHPLWSPDGKELYYQSISHADAPRPAEKHVALMAASIETAPALHAGPPHQLFDGPYFQGRGHDYALAADGKSFLMLREIPAPAQTEIKVILNWSAELNRRLPLK